MMVDCRSCEGVESPAHCVYKVLQFSVLYNAWEHSPPVDRLILWLDDLTENRHVDGQRDRRQRARR